MISEAELYQINQSKYHDSNTYILEEDDLSHCTIFSKDLNCLEHEEIVQTFSKQKMVLIRFEETINLEKNCEFLSNLFGKVIVQKFGKTNNGLFRIENIDGKTTAKTNKAQPLHTDHSFGYGFPEIVLLHCIQPATQGGYTKLVKAETIYNQLNFTSHFDISDQLVIYSTQHGEYKARNIFTKENGKFGVYWSPFTQKVIGTEYSEKIYRLIHQISQDSKNQITYRLKQNEMLIIDNLSILHSRTEFSTNDNRLIQRLWFDGKSTYNLCTGFSCS